MSRGARGRGARAITNRLTAFAVPDKSRVITIGFSPHPGSWRSRSQFDRRKNTVFQRLPTGLMRVSAGSGCWASSKNAAPRCRAEAKSRITAPKSNLFVGITTRPRRSAAHRGDSQVNAARAPKADKRSSRPANLEASLGQCVGFIRLRQSSELILRLASSGDVTCATSDQSLTLFASASAHQGNAGAYRDLDNR